MLKRGRRRLMKLCSASSASASVWVTSVSIESMRSIRSAVPPRPAPRPPPFPEKCDPTRLRIEFALPTYRAFPARSRKTYTPGASGSSRRRSASFSALAFIVSRVAPRLRVRGTLGLRVGSAPRAPRRLSMASTPETQVPLLTTDPPDLETIQIEVDGSVGTLILNRPDALNAMSPELIGELTTAAAWLADRAPIRCLIVTGAGRAFCSGGDVNWFKRGVPEEDVALPSEVRRGAEALHNAIVDIRRIPYPVIAAINGPAAGAGMSLALSADLRIASEDAFLAIAYGRIGAAPDGGMTYFLPRVVGPAKALELALNDPNLDAEAALDAGLVTEVVPADQLLGRAREKAEKLAAKAPYYVRMTKRLLHESIEHSLTDHLQLERHGIADSMATEDLRRGVTAFFEGEEPEFQGD